MTWPRDLLDCNQEENPYQAFPPVNRFVSGNLYLKSIPAETPSRELDELLELLTSSTNAYLANFKVDRKIPYPMRGFDQDMTGGGDDALRTGGTLADDVGDIARGAGLTRSQIDDIIKTPKGQRPNPSTYLAKEYIDHHLSQFKDGVTKFYAKAPTGTVGPREGTFLFPSSYADDMIKRANGDIRVLEQLLGFDPGDLGDCPIRIDISKP